MPHYLKPGIEDHRDLLSKFRRKELEAVLSAEGYTFPTGIPAMSAREMLRNSGVDPRKYVNERGEFIKPENVSRAAGVEDMKMTELRRFCAQNGINWVMTDKKVELQKKVQEHLRGNAS